MPDVSAGNRAASWRSGGRSRNLPAGSYVSGMHRVGAQTEGQTWHQPTWCLLEDSPARQQPGRHWGLQGFLFLLLWSDTMVIRRNGTSLISLQKDKTYRLCVLLKEFQFMGMGLHQTPNTKMEPLGTCFFFFLKLAVLAAKTLCRCFYVTRRLWKYTNPFH